jgi:hypothetical protein
MTADDIVTALATIPVVCAALAFALACAVATKRPAALPLSTKE